MTAVTEKSKTFVEILLETHHPLPWLPNKEEAEVYGSNRARLGSPDIDGLSEEQAIMYLVHRYNQVISGAPFSKWDVNDYVFGNCFEWALADLTACSLCQAAVRLEHHRFDLHGDENPNAPVTWAEWTDCRTVRGQGYYLDLDHKRTSETGRPCFAMTLCHTPLTRKGQIAGRMASYRD